MALRRRRPARGERRGPASGACEGPGGEGLHRACGGHVGRWEVQAQRKVPGDVGERRRRGWAWLRCLAFQGWQDAAGELEVIG